MPTAPSGTSLSSRPWTGRRGLKRILRPSMARILASQLPTNRRVMALPEAGEVTGDLNRTMIRRQQVQNQWKSPTPDPRSLLQPKEILEPGFDPRRLSRLVMHFELAPARQRNPLLHVHRHQP